MGYSSDKRAGGRSMKPGAFFTIAATLAAVAGAARAGEAVTAGELIVEPATLISLGFEWLVDGDDNRTASVAVAYRRKGERDWRASLPLLRLQRERTAYME